MVRPKHARALAGSTPSALRIPRVASRPGVWAGDLWGPEPWLHSFVFPSMVINDLNISRTVISPAKTDAILLIDSNTVLSFAVAGQRFKSIARWYPQFFQSLNRVQLVQFSRRGGPQLSGTTLARGFRVKPIEDILGAAISEGLNHFLKIACASCYDNSCRTRGGLSHE